MAGFCAVTKAIRIDCVTVILGRNVNRARREVLDRVVGTMVAEFQLECPCAKGPSQHLVAETDPHYRKASHQRLSCGHKPVEMSRVAGARRDHDPSGVHGQHVLRWSVTRENDRLVTFLCEDSGDVELQSGVKDRNPAASL